MSSSSRALSNSGISLTQRNQPVLVAATQNSDGLRSATSTIAGTSQIEEHDIATLEMQLEKLRTYGEHLRELGLTDSRVKVMELVQQIELRLKEEKRTKSRALISDMQGLFPELAVITLAEARRLGLE